MMEKMVKKYLDIDGVKVVFKVMKDKVKLSKEEILSELKRNITNFNEKIDNLENKLFNDYYTKSEVDSLLPDELKEIEVDSAYNESKTS